MRATAPISNGWPGCLRSTWNRWQSIETKRALRDWAWRRDALLFFQHDIAVPAGRLRVEGENWRVEAVDVGSR